MSNLGKAMMPNSPVEIWVVAKVLVVIPVTFKVPVLRLVKTPFVVV
jgi:hypothetical protein